MQPPRAAKHQRKRADYSRSHAYLRPLSAQIQAGRSTTRAMQSPTNSLEPIRAVNPGPHAGSVLGKIGSARMPLHLLAFYLRHSNGLTVSQQCESEASPTRCQMISTLRDWWRQPDHYYWLTALLAAPAAHPGDGPPIAASLIS